MATDKDSKGKRPKAGGKTDDGTGALATSAASADGAARNAGGDRPPAGRAGSLPMQLQNPSFVALVVSIVSLAAAITTPLWVPQFYGSPDSARFLVLGIAQLRPALESNEPFRNELAMVKRIMPNDTDVNKALETLAAYADKGVPTLPELRARFVKVANAIILNDIVGANKTWFDRTVIDVASAVHMHAVAHRLNDKRPSSEIVWAAQTRLEAGDLPGTIATLGKLTGPPAELAGPWIKEAQSRLAATKVLDLLDSTAQTRMSGWLASK